MCLIITVGYTDMTPDTFLVSMELIILNEFAKKQTYWVSVLNGAEYDYPTRHTIADCGFIAEHFISPFHSVDFDCNSADKAKEFLDAYLANYQQGALKSFAGKNVYTWLKSVRETLTVLIKHQQNYGNHFSVRYADFSEKVNFGADLISLERMKVLKIGHTGEYESSTDFECKLEVVGNLNETLKQLCGNPVPKQQVKYPFHDLKVYSCPFEVRFHQNKVALRENTLLAKLLVLLMKAPNHKCSIADLCRALYPKQVKAQQDKQAQVRLKSSCNSLNNKLKESGCSYKLHQENRYWCLKQG